jgi:23S rRNA pseudouridine2605 synthase
MDRATDRPAEGRPEGEALRLQLWLARAGVASRRQAEGLILAGRVSVDGQVITQLGSKAAPDADVRVDGKPVLLQERKVYLLLNKPAGYLSSMSDPEGRKLACDLLPRDLQERVYNVGRLDQWSSGLLIFTNDGEFARDLSHPSCGIEKEYEVATDVAIPQAFIEGFSAGLEVDGLTYKAASVRRTGEKGARIVLIEGKNREIRRVLEHFGLRALSLRRIRIGPVLIGNLPEGRSRELSTSELEGLRVRRPGNLGRKEVQ